LFIAYFAACGCAVRYARIILASCDKLAFYAGSAQLRIDKIHVRW